MATEEQGTAPELTEHEQAMVDLVDDKEAATAGLVDPENASEYVEPKEEPSDEATTIDYKAKYEELLAKESPEAPPKTPEGLEIESKTEDVTPPEENQEVSALTPEQMGKFSTEFDVNGSLSDESYSELQNLGLSKAVVDTYIEGQAAIVASRNAKVFEKVGGAESYSEMISWAKENWTPQQVEVFNSQVQSGNEANIMFGVESLSAQYKAASGSPMPKRALSGSSQGTSGGAKGYSDKGEMYKAMRNPMYGKDASYTNSVAKKIEQSSF